LLNARQAKGLEESSVIGKRFFLECYRLARLKGLSKRNIDLGRLFRPTLSFFLGSVCNITIAAYVYSDAFSGACHRQKGATPRGSLNRASFDNHHSDDFHHEDLPLKA